MAIDFADLAIRVKYEDVDKATASLDRLAAAGDRAERATSDVGTGSGKASQQVGAFAKINEEAAKHTSGHALGIGKVEHALQSMLIHATGANHVIGVIATTMLQFGVGGIVTVGVLGGLAAMAYVWERYTEKVREAEKAQNDLAKSALAAFQTAALGPGGESANVATAAAGRISELQYQREHIRDLTSTDRKLFESPEKATNRIDQEIGQLQNLLKDAETRVSVARAKEFAQSITTPFDLAAARGQDILHFYDEAKASQGQLNELAKSGTFEVKDAALQALGTMDKIINHVKLIRLGLAEAPSQLLGLPSDVALGGAKTTLANLLAGVRAPGANVGNFSGQIDSLGNLLSRAHGEATGSNKTQVDELTRQLTIIAEGGVLAGAARGDREGIAANIRAGHRTTGDPFVQNAAAQAKYSEDLALREAALRLPDAFDAAREAAVRHGEAMRNLDDEIEVAKKAFTSIDGAMGNFKEGLKEAATSFAQRFSPGAIANNLLGKVAGDTSSVGGELGGGAGLAIGAYLGGPIGAAIGAAIGSRIGNTIQGLFGGGAGARTAQREAADSAHAMALQIDEVTKALSGDQLGAAIDALQIQLISALQAINSALPGTKNEAERNRLRAEAAAQEQQQEAKARHQDELNRRYAEEDLQVRNLRALGQGDAADRLAFQEQQQREMQKAIDDGRDATYLNTLATTQNNELLAYLNGLLTDATLNAPSGFFASAYYSQFATPRSSPSDPFGTGMLPPNYPTEPPGTGAAGGSGLRPPGGRAAVNATINLTVDGKVLTSVVVKNIDQSAAATGGAGSSRSDALNRMAV